jgi:hypothetical protein
MELQSGVTYIFKYKDGSFQVNSTNDEKANKDLKFTATFIDVLTNDDGYRTLRVENKIIENNKIPGMVTMPYDWIESAVLLDGWTK